MSDYKLVPLEPTPEWVANLIRIRIGSMESLIEDVLAAAPDVQGEPVGWYTEDHLDDKSATTYSAEVAQRWRAKGWPVTPLYTAPQPAGQQPGVAQLVEALTAMLEIHGVTQSYAEKHIEIPQSWVDVSDIARAALAAYRKQESRHDNQ